MYLYLLDVSTIGFSGGISEHKSSIFTHIFIYCLITPGCLWLLNLEDALPSKKVTPTLLKAQHIREAAAYRINLAINSQTKSHDDREIILTARNTPVDPQKAPRLLSGIMTNGVII